MVSRWLFKPQEFQFNIVSWPFLNECVKVFTNDSYYGNQYQAVRQVIEQMPSNRHLEDVLVKVALINTFYSTHILDVYTVAKNVADFGELDNRYGYFFS